SGWESPPALLHGRGPGVVPGVVEPGGSRLSLLDPLPGGHRLTDLHPAPSQSGHSEASAITPSPAGLPTRTPVPSHVRHCLILSSSEGIRSLQSAIGSCVRAGSHAA